MSSDSSLILSTSVDSEQEGTVRVKLKKPRTGKQVKWGQDTVDNENMNKKKSKCCCIYKKPKAFDEDSSSDSDEECANCPGHKTPKEDGHKHPVPVVSKK